MDAYEKFNAKILGSGDRVMVFAHGLALDQNIWRLVVPAFTAHYKVVLFDYVGCGKSNKGLFDAQKYCSLEGYAQDVNELCDQLRLKDVVFIAHSISSMIGLIAALKKPEYFERFIFITPSPRYINDVDGYIGGYQKSDVDQIIKQIEQDYVGWIRASVPAMVHESNSPELIEEVVQAFIANDKDMLKQFALASFFIDYRKDLLKFDKPSLIIQSADDLVAPLQVGDYLHAHLTQSKLVRLKTKGHFPQLTSPKEIITAIKKFVGKPTPNA